MGCVLDGVSGFEPQRLLCNLMREVMGILKSGDRAVGRVDRLDELLHGFHDLFMHMYGRCATPKLHLARHIPDAFRCSGNLD